jgi:hypothetical protein
VLALAGVLLAAAALAERRPLGPPLLEISLPVAEEAVVANEALEVFVHFPYTERTRPETLHVTLNGADVTDSFSVAENGAIGDVVLLVDGANVLRVGVFGRAWWGRGRLVEHTTERRFRVRRRIDRNWGQGPLPAGPGRRSRPI